MNHKDPLSIRYLQLPAGLLLASALLGGSGALAQVVEPSSQLSSTRTVAYERDTATGVVTAEVLEPTSAQHCLRKAYGRDSFGNVVSTTVQNCPGLGAAGSAVLANRIETQAHSAAADNRVGLYPNTQTNAAGHVEQLQHHNAFGLPMRVQDANGLVTQYSYDGFGRRLRAIHPDGNLTQWRYDYCGAQAPSSGIEPPVALPTCPASIGAAVRMAQIPMRANSQVNGAITVEFQDAQGRTLQTQTRQFATVGNPRWSVVSTVYDEQGRVAQKSAPYFDGDTPTDTSFKYDALGRVTEESTPNPYASGGVAVRKNEYTGRTIVSTNPRGYTQTRELDEFDRTIRLTDAKGSQQSYQFTAWGQLHQTRDPLGNVTRIFYDQSGNKSRMIDPGMGSWSYRHDPLGQLRSQTNPKGQTVTLAYDNLGRMVSRTEPDLTSTFHFDVTAANAACASGITSKGLLCEAKSGNGYRRLNQYDNQARIVQSGTTVASTGSPYVSKIVYNTDGRISQQVWPTGLAVSNTYDSDTGALIEMKLAPSGQSIWRRVSNNARGQFTQVWYGNGAQTINTYEPNTGLLQASTAGPGAAPTSLIDQAYSYNANSHLTQRTDRKHATDEIFSYDELNRLTRSLLNNTANAQLLRNLNYQYDALGNITYNSEVGVYTYATGAGARPHAVQSISGQAGKTLNPVYGYDLNGNIVSVTGSNGVRRTHTWTSFDNPGSFSLSQDNVKVDFLYGPEHQRIREISTRTVGGVTTVKTLNVLHPDNEGGLFFEREDKTVGSVSSSENRHYISAEKGAFLLITSSNPIQSNPVATSQTTSVDLRYWHKDHLGSIVASTNASGGLIERMAYDPFGKRRNINGAFDQTGTIEPTSTNRGFTGHEHLDELDFIHMNARVYDPDIGRFLSADPTVAYVDNPQSFNRYSYTQNNPISRVDPTGFTDIRFSREAERAAKTAADKSIPTPSSGANASKPAHERSSAADPAPDNGTSIQAMGAMARSIVGAAVQAMVPTGEDVSIAAAMGPYALAEPTPLGEMAIAGVYGSRAIPRAIDAVGAVLKRTPALDVDAAAKLRIPGRVTSRINVPTKQWEHVIKEHFSKKPNKSQFTITEAELRDILSSEKAINTPISRVVGEGDAARFFREIDVGKTVGTDKHDNHKPTSTMTTITDRFGNLQSTFPGKLE